MKPIYKRYVRLVAWVWTCCFLLLVCVYFLVLAPQKKCEKLLETKLAEIEKMHRSAKKAERPETKLKLSEEMENLRSKLHDFVIDFENSANLTFDISQIANNKKVDSFSIKAKEKNSGSAIRDSKYINESNMVVKFNSEFNQFASFLNALERHRPVVFIDKFAITRSKDDDVGNPVRMNLAFLLRKQQDG